MKNLTANNVWYNELGSVMTLEVDGDIIRGTYQSRVGDAHGIYQLIGMVNNDGDQSMAIGWVVVWQNEYGNSDAVTTWSGQAQLINGEPTIVTTWLLTSETDPSDNWHSTLVGKDVFTTIPPTKDEIEANLGKGVKSSYPKKK